MSGLYNGFDTPYEFIVSEYVHNDRDCYYYWPDKALNKLNHECREEVLNILKKYNCKHANLLSSVCIEDMRRMYGCLLSYDKFTTGWYHPHSDDMIFMFKMCWKKVKILCNGK